MTALTYLSAIRLSGSDAGDFLHNQLSADVLALSSGEAVFACYCEPKGRVLALMLVNRHGDDYYVVLSASLAISVAQRLRIYVMRAQVNIEVLENCVVSGAHAGDETSQAELPLITIEVPGCNDRLTLRTDGTNETTDPALLDAWKISELQRGITWLCPETSGQFLPQMLGYDKLGAVNYRKGCYPGQEIVARTHYLGKVKRHPRLLCTTAVVCPNPLDKIQINCDGDSYAAVIVDCGHRVEGGGCLYAITRMDPDLTAQSFDFQGAVAPLD